MSLSTDNRSLVTGWLILRVGIGLLFVMHGVPKLASGMDGWAGLGGYGMGALGINLWPALFGFMAAFSEGVGGLLIALGLFTRPMACLCAFTMFVATVVKIKGLSISSGAGIITIMGDFGKSAGHPLSMLIVFLAIVFIGGGCYALGQRYFGNRWWA